MGNVPVGTPDLDEALDALRARAARLEPESLACQLIIGNEQIRYMTIDAEGDGAARRAKANAAMEQATPYALDELVLDISADGPQTHVAAVARETLAEAEAFALENGFDPVCFVAIPGDEAFLGEPFFGPTKTAGSRDVESTGIAIVIVGDIEDDEQVPELEPAPIDEAEPVADDMTGQDTSPQPDAPATKARPGPVPSFVSRRGADETETETENAPDQEEQAEKSAAISLLDGHTPAIDPADDHRRTAQIPPPTAATTHRGKAEPPVTTRTTPIADPAPEAALTSFAPSGRITDETERLTLFGERRGQALPRSPAAIRYAIAFAATVAAAAILLAGLYWGGLGDVFTSAEQAELTDTPEQVIQPPRIEAQVPARAPAAETAAATAPAETPAEPAPELTATAPVTLAVPATAPQPEEVALPPATRPDPPVAGRSGQDGPVTAPAPMDTAALDIQRDSPPVTPQSAPAEEPARPAPELTSVAPMEPEPAALITLDQLFVASIDRRDLSQDAVALIAPRDLQTDGPPRQQSSPAAAGTDFQMDQRGLVDATPEGTLNPDGIMVYLGKPPVVPPPTPERADPEAEARERLATLAAIRPLARPGGFAETAERAQLGGVTREELAAVRPLARPETLKAPAEGDETPTAQAVATSLKPLKRPADIAQVAAAATPTVAPDPAQPATQPTVAARIGPTIPSSASVAKQATIGNAINLRRVNLMGISGTPSKRRALVRLPSGRYKHVEVGDRLDGGQVIAIGESELRYKKGSRNIVLKIAGG